MNHERPNENLQPEDRQAAEIRERIGEAVEAAFNTGRRINDVTAKRIASSIAPDAGALREFADTGAILPEIELEIATVVESAPDVPSDWLTALGHYCEDRQQKGAMSFWNEEGMA